MRRSQLFVKTRHQVPADETSKSAQLLIRAGYIHKDAAGVYALLPFGLATVEKIKQIVREEMDGLGSNEILMTSLQRKELWQKTDRWDDKKVDVWFKSMLKNGAEVGLGWSHEEPISDMMKEFIASYRDLPTSVYQFQTKLRNELRAKSGVMRAREFVMKDMYSYSRSQAEHQKFYDQTIDAYHRVFKRLAIDDRTYLTFASGGDFTQFSHEFQTICEAGEDTAYLDKTKKIAVNEEVMSDEVLAQLRLDKTKLQKVTVAEVGNIFGFGTTKSQQLGLYFTDEDGSKKPVVLGSYGIGITRLLGVLAEIFADDRGLVWPQNVAPFEVYLARLGDDKTVVEAADDAYRLLTEAGVGVIYDDRNVRPGEMFADADLIGLPKRLVVSKKTVQKNAMELKNRTSDKVQLVEPGALAKTLRD
jgi:prolyl-tRNA synthetase